MSSMRARANRSGEAPSDQRAAASRVLLVRVLSPVLV
jgi:hypothetical protein